MEGLIIKNISNDYVVNSNNQLYICKPRGKFRKDKITPLVGDYVTFDEDNNYIIDIHTRKNSLIRPSVANIDNALIVTSVKEPNLDTNLLDKLLTIISYNNIEPIICFTKLDLLTKEERKNIDDYINYYKNIGYKVVTNEQASNFNNLFKNKITVLTGQSGAGKSSLLNMLDNNLKLKTNEISYALNRGKHTTRHTELLEIEGGLVADTPGFSALDFHEMTNEDIRDNFIEFNIYRHDCSFNDCMHVHEKNCKIKEKVEDGTILKSRYENYLKFISR